MHEFPVPTEQVVPLAATPEFHAVFTADLDSLSLRVRAALEALATDPANAEAQGVLGTCLHGLKGLAGMVAAQPLVHATTRLERLAELATRLAGNGDAAQARAAFAACRGPDGELEGLVEATLAGRGNSPAAEVAAERLCAALTPRWPGLETATPEPPRPMPAEESDVLVFLHELGVGTPTPATPTPAAEPVEAPGFAEATAAPAPAEAETDAVDAEMLQYFLPETQEYTEEIERALGELENPATAREGMAAPGRVLMRMWHTIKGAANSIGLTTIGRLAHSVEEAFAEGCPLSADEQRRVGGTALEILREFLRDCAASPPGTQPVSPTLPVNALVAHLARLQRDATTRPAPAAAEEEAAVVAPTPTPSQQPAPTAERLAATTPEPGFENPGARVDPGTLDKLMDLVGELTVSRNRLLSRVQTFTQVQSELESCKNRLLRVVGSFQEQHEYSANQGRPGHGANGSSKNGSATARPAGFGELEFDEYSELNLLSRALVEIGADTGELIDQSRRFFGTFTEDTDKFRKVSTQLQEAITQVRMVPMTALFRRLRRVVTEAAGKEGKDVAWETEGSDTRLDKVIVESLFGPLLHLVRNAVSHGVEAPGKREAAGKSRTGRLHLRASQKSNHAVLELEDDGAGLNFGAIRERGVAAGLIGAAEAEGWDESRLVGLIFRPGFSTRTAEEVNDVSGRGIGLDVVLQQITRLGGSIDVQSRAGRGCVLTLRLPMTLAIGQAMFVQVGGQTFALPLTFVDRVAPCLPEMVSPDPEAPGQGRLAVENVEGGFVPLVRLERLLGLPDAAPGSAGAIPLALIVRVADRRLAIPIESILRRADTVTKPLGPLLADHPFFSGGTVDNDGRVVLILDVPRLAQGFFAGRGVFALVGMRTAATGDEVVKPMPTPVRAREAVLVVDDSLSVRKVAEKLVTELGYEVETANDGVAALEALARRQFVCVLTDLEMPRLDGFGLLEEIRSRAAMRDLPVIVVTSRQAEKHREHAAALGATDYLVKPFSKAQLAEKLARVRANLDAAVAA